MIFFLSFSLHTTSKKMSTSPKRCPRCVGKTSDNKSCKRPASCRINCQNLCWQHAKSYSKASRRCLRRQSSRRRSQSRRQSARRSRSRSRSAKRASLTGVAKEIADQMPTGQWVNITRLIPTGVSLVQAEKALRAHMGTHFEGSKMRWKKL